MDDTEKRDAEIVKMNGAGSSNKAIAKKTGISAYRVAKIINTAKIEAMSDMDYRPTSKKMVRQHDFLQSLALNNFDTRAALKIAEVPRQTYQQWCTETDFTVQLHSLREEACRNLEALAWQIAKGEYPGMDKPSPDMIKFILKNLHKEFQDIKKIQIEGKVEHKHEHDFSGWSTEQLEHYVETGEELTLGDDGVYESTKE